jgi:hypothetical protein
MTVTSRKKLGIRCRDQSQVRKAKGSGICGGGDERDSDDFAEMKKNRSLEGSIALRIIIEDSDRASLLSATDNLSVSVSCSYRKPMKEQALQ